MSLILTNGCFDVLHDGHLALLGFCRSLGSQVVVAINTDDSVQRLKGFYPANRAQARMDALQATQMVDRVILFNSETELAQLVTELKPSVLVKGGDYRGRIITGQKEIEALGGHVEFFDLVPGLSSTAAIANAGVSKARVKSVSKGWGHELWIVNNDRYCGKELHFEEGRQTSMHFHALKDETWMVKKGRFEVVWIDPLTSRRATLQLVPGDTVRVKPLHPHKIICLEAGYIFEVSTQHLDTDSYRVEPGSSQR